MDPAARKTIEQEKDSIYLCHSTWAAAHEAASTVAKASLSFYISHKKQKKRNLLH